MLAYIKGTLEMKMTEYVVIDVGGLGYKIFMSEVGIEKLGNIGENVKVHTYYRVREDDISIYGFNTLEELKMFELLLGVSGVGAKTALAMLAVCEPSEFALAVIAEDVKTLTGIPGIGPKSAKRIILELKDKMSKDVSSGMDFSGGKDASAPAIFASKATEAAQALAVLGYSSQEVSAALKGVDVENLPLEEIIRQSLKKMVR